MAMGLQDFSQKKMQTIVWLLEKSVTMAALLHVKMYYVKCVSNRYLEFKKKIFPDIAIIVKILLLDMVSVSLHWYC